MSGEEVDRVDAVDKVDGVKGGERAESRTTGARPTEASTANVQGPVVDERLRGAMGVLSNRHRLWVLAFCGDGKFNATAAAIAAGYSRRRADVTGAEIRARPDVREAVEAFLASAETDAVMDFWEAAARLSAIGRSSLRQYLGEDGRLDLEAGPEQGLQEVRITESVDKEGNVTKRTTIKIRDPERAIRSLGDLLGWAPKLVFGKGLEGETPEEQAEDMSKTIHAWRLARERARREVGGGEVAE